MGNKSFGWEAAAPDPDGKKALTTSMGDRLVMRSSTTPGRAAAHEIALKHANGWTAFVIGPDGTVRGIGMGPTRREAEVAAEGPRT